MQYDWILIAFLMSLISGLLLYPLYIRFMRKLKYGQSISEYSLKEDQEKKGTPTMGGVLFVLITIITTIFTYPNFVNDEYVVMVLLMFFGYALIGFVDDFIIIVEKNNKGLPALMKFVLQVILAVTFYTIYREQLASVVRIPFIDYLIGNRNFYPLLLFFMFVGASNAVNITDGMDGLAGGTTFIAFVPFLILACTQGEIGVAVFIAALMGAILSFLRYNIKPAKIFMGDAGSLALGGALAAVSVVLKVEIAFVIIGGVFVYETLCVMLQIGSVKLRKKRIFRYTPIHYSFRLRGIPEQKVVYLFWLAGIICAIVGYWVALS